MYDELIKRIRQVAEEVCEDYDVDPYNAEQRCLAILQAADAIEELAAFKAHITDGHFYCMRDGVLYEAKVELPKGKVFQLPPIAFMEEGERMNFFLGLGIFIAGVIYGIFLIALVGANRDD